MEKKRLFIGTFIAQSLFKSFYPKLQDDFQNISKGKWVEPENLHFTYKFLGDVEVILIPKIQECLNDYLKSYNNELIIKGLSAFPNLNRPNVLHIEIHNPDNILLRIQRKIDLNLEQLGFEREKRKFSPHITLQRIKFAKNPDFKTLIQKYKDFSVGEMNSFNMDLIESRLTPQGPIYKRISN